MLTAALAPLAEQFNQPLQQFTLGLQGSCIVAIAVSSLVCNTLAVKIGKRPVYIVTSILLMVSCFWAAESKSFGSLAAARAVQGFAMAPMEALVPASIADIWFVHERGFQSAVFNLGVLGGINLASPIGEWCSPDKQLATLEMANIKQLAPSSNTGPTESALTQWAVPLLCS